MSDRPDHEGLRLICWGVSLAVQILLLAAAFYLLVRGMLLASVGAAVVCVGLDWASRRWVRAWRGYGRW